MKITLYSLIAGLRPAGLILRRRITFLLIFVSAGLMLVQPCAGGPSIAFENTYSLATARYSPTSTLLLNGRVLVAEGQSSSSEALADAELKAFRNNKEVSKQ